MQDSSIYLTKVIKVHVQQRHSADKMFLNILMIPFWCNPFFWLIRRELDLIHEFIADGKTIPDANPEALSSLILSSAYPSVPFTITSHYSFSPVKRRLLMFTQHKKNTNNYYSRFLMIPVLLGLLFAFSFTHKNANEAVLTNKYHPANKTYTIVIDTGHGGTDAGAVAADGTEEKNIVLAIAKKIRQLNTNRSIDIQLSREDDVLQDLHAKVAAAISKNPDAFISLHVNKVGAGSSGFDLYVSRKTTSFTKQSILLGTLLSKEIKEIYPIAPELQKRINQGIWVLDAPVINYPAVLMECGNIGNAKDLSYITDSAHQTEIAAHILKGIEAFTTFAGAQ
jgi:N-acetylmuramoyl-L-alanine amidase